MTPLKYSFVFFIIALALTLSAHADWTHINGPTGEDITCFTSHGTTIFAGSRSGVYRSTDNGLSWNWKNGISSNSITSIGSTIVISSVSYGTFSSTDNGENWTKILENSSSNLAVNGGIVFRGNYDGIYRSFDTCKTWEKLSTIFTSASLCTKGNSLIAYGRDTSTTSKHYPIGISNDNGVNWTYTYSDKLDNLHDYDGKIAVHDTTLFIGVFRSTDNGKNWTNIALGKKNPLDCTLFTNGGSALYVAGDYTHRDLYRSTDNGDTWTEVRSGLSGNVIQNITAIGQVIYAGTGNSGVYRSTDNGETWNQSNAGFPYLEVTSLVEKDSILFAGTSNQFTRHEYGGIYRSTNRGVTWTEINKGLANLNILSLAVSGNTLFAATSIVGVYRSSDNGDNWTRLEIDTVMHTEDTYLAVSELGVFVTVNYKLFHSTDNGDNWTTINGNFPFSGNNSIAAKGNVVCVGSEDLIMRFIYKDKKWTQKSIGNRIEWPYTNILAIKDSTVFTLSDVGLLRITSDVKGGLQVDKILGDYIPGAFIVHGSTLYAAVGSIQKSHNDGETWALVDSTLKKNVLTLMIGGSTLYAGTQNEGIWKLTINTTGISENMNKETDNYSTFSCYPNPATNTLTIDRTTLQFPENTPVHYTLSTLVSGKVMEFYNSEPKFTVPLEGITSGIYCLTAEQAASKVAVMVTVAK